MLRRSRQILSSATGIGSLALVYGGFAGLVATLVFLYLSAVSLIFGAEINAVLRDGPAGPEE
jgi:membrane protein